MHFIIADDHPLFRGALRQVLSGQSENVEIIEAGDFDTVRKLVGEKDDTDLLLLDLTMPGGTGLSGLVALKALQPALPIIIVSATDDPATIHHALELGASGFISKSASMETIGEAVGAVLAGDIWTPDDINLDHPKDPEIESLIARLRTLTPQQTRVLTMLAEGLLNKQIAFELGVSEATVKAHVSAVLQKLGVDSRTQAVILLSRIGSDVLGV
ncbi:response regulator [Brucella sp. 10RB9214]|uniref:response regulator transcription factor n=1 Tax=unclassified Brucella TaxID=2632610 RepID=UPI0009729CDE|nr:MULTISPECIES: response regulator transcription factor [unclassified Brucella]APY13520.1 DNA-binding response regulator [Brucella sp. 09RB8910]MRN45219.1 response regulator [Brucella sp. 10RB9212]MRN48413.1 response regulator [Brucella sp. 10RB9214]